MWLSLEHQQSEQTRGLVPPATERGVCIALGIYCPTTKRLLRGHTDSSRQIGTLASSQSVEDSADEQATARNGSTITNRWRFYVNIRFGVALNLAEGANAARGMMNTMLVVLLAIATGCTGFVTVGLFFLILGGCTESDL